MAESFDSLKMIEIYLYLSLLQTLLSLRGSHWRLSLLANDAHCTNVNTRQAGPC